MIRDDREPLAEPARVNSDVVPLAMRIMDDSATAAEQHELAQRLIAAGERLHRRARSSTPSYARAAVTSSARTPGHQGNGHPGDDRRHQQQHQRGRVHSTDPNRANEQPRQRDVGQQQHRTQQQVHPAPVGQPAGQRVEQDRAQRDGERAGHASDRGRTGWRRAPQREGGESSRSGSRRRGRDGCVSIMTTTTSTTAPSALRPTARPRTPVLHRAVGWAAVAGTLPYLTLKALWLARVDAGLPDPAMLTDSTMIAMNGITAAMDALVIALALALTHRWGYRLPAWLLLLPVWVGTGFLVPIAVVNLPATVFLLGAGSTVADGSLAPWVGPLVYGGFAWPCSTCWRAAARPWQC